MEIKKDLICQVFAGKKSKSTIELVLNTFIPGYEKLNTDYTCKPEDKEYVFKTEDEMINYFIENSQLSQTFYWNKYHDNPDNIMVGANITKDDKLIISLTIDGNEVTEKLYFEKLKEILNSKIGVITYFNPAEYDNGQDFISRYGKNTKITP
ncbi:hypothetical protein [uncultured Flavobacterium sp.]|uniref:hypothetical protein n=1 Tax=uncultured Flavobacterium sp. TaxID=165435 RepID=UPI003081DEBB